MELTMMYESKKLECLSTQKQAITLHPEVIEILFENRPYVKKVFSNLRGLHGITHMAMACIDPSDELMVFSSTPTIEYNLIHQNLWVHDHAFVPEAELKNALLWWDYPHDKLEKIKLKHHHLTVGMTICRPIGDFRLVYSFATDEKYKNLRQYYTENLFGLIDMGDYFYKSLRERYNVYVTKHTPPNLSEFSSKASGLSIKPFLRVVQNTNKGK
jgi:hypothetical protein